MQCIIMIAVSRTVKTLQCLGQTPPKTFIQLFFLHTLHRFITFIDIPNVYTLNIHLLKLLAASVINLCGFSVMDSNTKALF